MSEWAECRARSATVRATPSCTEPSSAAAGAAPNERVTHGRHCTCSACAREDWTRITGPCGMHGADCPAEYAPIAAAGGAADKPTLTERE